MPSQTAENSTVDLILSRLPAKPLLSPSDIASAIGAASTKIVLEAIQTGRISAVRCSRHYIVSHSEAERYIRASAYQPDEA